MKHLKELRTLLIAIFCINRCSGNEDKDITNILDYTFNRLYNNNSNLITLYCLGKDKNEVMKELIKIFNEDTEYLKFLEDKNESI